jgi:hypothetical protein
VAIASFLCPLEHFLEQEGPAPPVGLADLVAHVRELVPEAGVPHLVGVCSPSGFTEDARQSGLELPNITLLLVTPREDGGWEVVGTSPNTPPADCKVFDPEAVARKIERVREEVQGRSADLLTGGLSAERLGERLGLPARVVAAAFEQMAVVDGELKLSRERDDVLLWRGAPVAGEDYDMSMADRIRQLFGREGNEARKINALAERRVKLVQRRERFYADIAQLETREADLLRQGRETTSPAVKRRVASQIKQLRDDMDRLNATARMLGQQVEVVSTHIHNLTLIQQGQIARLPPAEELTADAVRAEEMLEQLNADAELATSLSTGAARGLTSEEELAILSELEGPVPEAKPATGAAATVRPERAPPAAERKSPERREPEPG